MRFVRGALWIGIHVNIKSQKNPSKALSFKLLKLIYFIITAILTVNYPYIQPFVS